MFRPSPPSDLRTHSFEQTRILICWLFRTVDTVWVVPTGNAECTIISSSISGEYWAEICQAYFDCNRINNWNHSPIGTREQLKVYDPLGYDLVRSTFRLGPGTDWRYRFPRKLPCVEPPPMKTGIDPYYTKFCWARTSQQRRVTIQISSLNVWNILLRPGF